MAAGSAHFASITQIKPSIFDLDAQSDLKELLKPISKNFIWWLSQKFPQFSAALSHPNSLSLVIALLIESYYLQKYGGTFSESFYGLKRVDGEKLGLSRTAVTKSLAAEEVLPFLLSGLNNISERFYYESLSGRKREIISAVIRLNTAVQIAFQLLGFTQRLRYITGKTEYHSPLLWLTGLKLGYADPVQETFSWRNFLPIAVQRSFEIGVFLLQCYHWWQTESHGVLGRLPAPPPPEVPYESTGFDGVCPICRKRREIDTVLSISGFVFCFVCIQKFVSDNHKCPVTGLPASIHNLIRIYPDDC